MSDTFWKIRKVIFSTLGSIEGYTMVKAYHTNLFWWVVAILIVTGFVYCTDDKV